MWGTIVQREHACDQGVAAAWSVCGVQYHSVAVVVAKFSADGPVCMLLNLLLVREHHGLTEPGELQLHARRLLQGTRQNSISTLSTCCHQVDRRRYRHLVRVGTSDSNGVEKVFEAVGDWPQAEGHFTRNQDVSVVKEVDVAPGQRTVLLEDV